MLNIVLVLQVLILSLFWFLLFYVQNTIGDLSIQVSSSMVVLEDMKNVLPEIEVALENFNQLESLFENLGKLSDLLSVLNDPFGSNG